MARNAELRDPDRSAEVLLNRPAEQLLTVVVISAEHLRLGVFALGLVLHGAVGEGLNEQAAEREPDGAGHHARQYVSRCCGHLSPQWHGKPRR
jgi:hypothetical protein